jgi:hypothetical protein
MNFDIHYRLTEEYRMHLPRQQIRGWEIRVKREAGLDQFSQNQHFSDLFWPIAGS